MATSCRRLIIRTAASKIASVKPAAKTIPTMTSASPRFRFPLPTSSATSPLRRLSVSRMPSELGCALSLFPLHSAVAAARMRSCLGLSTSCRALSQEREFQVRALALLAGIITLQPYSMEEKSRDEPKPNCSPQLTYLVYPSWRACFCRLERQSFSFKRDLQARHDFDQRRP